MSILNLGRLLRRVRESKALKARLDAYSAGYDWAAGTLLRGETTPRGIEACTDNPLVRTQFDAGAEAATSRLIDAGMIEDDRV